MSDLAGYGIVARIERLRATGATQWIARCPAHDDSTESLSISVGEGGRLLLHCQAGCSVADVVRAVGGTIGDLFPERLSQRTSSNGSAGKPPQGKIVATYGYRDAAGTLLYQSCRIEPGPSGRSKTFRQRAPRIPGDEKSGWTWKVAHIARVLYRLPEILAAPPARPVLIVEGEKDADNLARGGFVATTNVGGAGKWFTAYSAALAGRHCVIIPDNDEPGRKHATEVAASLMGHAASIRVLTLDNLPIKGDVSDWIRVAGNTPARLRGLIESCPRWDPAAPPAAGEPAQPATGTAAGVVPYATNLATTQTVTPVVTQTVTQPNPATEYDDDPHRLARLFLARFAHPDGPTLRFWRDTWWRWDGQIYVDIPAAEIRASLTQAIKAEFDRIVTAKLAAGPSLADNGPPRSMKVTGRLLSDTLQALAGLVILPGTTDAPAWLDAPGSPAAARGPVANYLCLANGILSIPEILADDPDPTRYLAPHTPALFTRNRIPYPFDPAADCPAWRQFLATSLQGDAENEALLQEWFGYCITPDTSMQRFLMLEGEGANGKSVVCAALTALLGQSNVSHVPLEMFGKDFVLTQTLGKLANIASEVGELDKIAEGYLKSFTAGDRMTFNRKRKDLIEATPSARLILSTNNFPRYADKSQGIWRRVLLLQMTYVVPDDQRVFGMDKPEWWERSGELPGMLLWALAGLQEIRRYRRFTEPAGSKDAIIERQREANPLRIFLSEHYEESPDPDDTIPIDALYKKYSDWCKANGLHAMSSVSVGKEIARIFRNVSRQRIRDDFNNRCWGYRRIKELSNMHEPENPPL